VTIIEEAPSRVETVGDLRAFAADRGVPIAYETIRVMRRDRGSVASRDTIRRAARLIDFAALELGVELTYPMAARRLAGADQDVDKACGRLRAQVSCGEVPATHDTAKEFARFAANHGVSVADHTARRHAARDGDPRQQVKSLVRVLDEASKLGLDVDERSARGRLVQAQGDADAVIARMRSQVVDLQVFQREAVAVLGLPGATVRSRRSPN
jgi:hypothetical protein